MSFVDIAIVRFLSFAHLKALQDRRAPWYQRGLIGKPLARSGALPNKCTGMSAISASTATNTTKI